MNPNFCYQTSNVIFTNHCFITWCIVWQVQSAKVMALKWVWYIYESDYQMRPTFQRLHATVHMHTNYPIVIFVSISSCAVYDVCTKFGYIMAWRSYSITGTSYNIIIIIMQTGLKAFINYVLAMYILCVSKIIFWLLNKIPVANGNTPWNK